MKLHNGNAVEGSRKAKNIHVRLTGMSLETSQREDQRYNTTLYILVMLKSNIYLATCSGCSLCSVCLSAARSQRAGGARPVSDSLMPVQLKKKKIRHKASCAALQSTKTVHIYSSDKAGQPFQI